MTELKPTTPGWVQCTNCAEDQHNCALCDYSGWKPLPFESEADLVQEFIHQISSKRPDWPWTIYPETANWDLLLAHRDGYQIGIEAKMSLNAKVIDQALEGASSEWAATDGPDYRAVLVPSSKVQQHLSRICKAIGIKIIGIDREWRSRRFHSLPDQNQQFLERSWVPWLPSRRCQLPDYVPDVSAGHKSPVKLTEWKIKAIKLMILLERRGIVMRDDMRALQISPTRWTDAYQGFLDRSSGGGYVKGENTPDLKAQHPENWAQIEADFDIWNPYAGLEAK